MRRPCGIREDHGKLVLLHRVKAIHHGACTHTDTVSDAHDSHPSEDTYNTRVPAGVRTVTVVQQVGRVLVHACNTPKPRLGCVGIRCGSPIHVLRRPVPVPGWPHKHPGADDGRPARVVAGKWPLPAEANGVLPRGVAHGNLRHVWPAGWQADACDDRSSVVARAEKGPVLGHRCRIQPRTTRRRDQRSHLAHRFEIDLDKGPAFKVRLWDFVGRGGTGPR